MTSAVGSQDGTALSVVIVETDALFTLDALSRACATEPQHVLALVAEGVLTPTGTGPHDWVFAGTALSTVRMAVRLRVELDLSIGGAAIVLGLLQEMAVLRARLRRAGIE